MFLLPALALAAAAPSVSCPDLTSNAAKLCANREIARAWADVETAHKEWLAADTRKAMIAERREEALADLRRGFDYSGENDPPKGNPDLIIESLGYVASGFRDQAVLARSIATPSEMGRELARTCMAKVVVSCVVESAGFLNAGGTARARQIAWQYVSGLEPNGGIPLRMTMAWDISGDRPVLIGFTSTEGEGDPPRLVDNGEDMILHLPARTAGTGEGNADSLFLFKPAGWVNIGLASWKNELPSKLPKGLGLWKGVEYQYYGLSSTFPLWRDNDANCCPTAGEAYVNFKVVNDRLSIADVQFTPAPAVQVKPLACLIEQAVYRSSWPTRFLMRFQKPPFPPNAQSDLIAILELLDEDGTPVFRRYFAFAGSNGFGSASIFAVDGPGDTEGPPALIEGQEDAETLYFHAFMGEPNGLKYIAEPPQADSPAPLGLFLPDLARNLWYDGIPNPKGGPPVRVELPRDMWHGECVATVEP